jgi:hypothetical protein
MINRKGMCEASFIMAKTAYLSEWGDDGDEVLLLLQATLTGVQSKRLAQT